MSGEILRTAAQLGDVETVRTLCEQVCNPCSADEYGLTALMYAVWNGHLECVKLLACNDFGVDHNGQKGSSLNMITTRGYTALHLACLDCPFGAAEDIIKVLLAVHADVTIKSRDGKLPLDIAKSNGLPSTVLQLFEDFDAETYDNMRETLFKKFKFRKNAAHSLTVTAAATPVEDKSKAGATLRSLDLSLKKAIDEQLSKLKVVRSGNAAWNPDTLGSHIEGEVIEAQHQSKKKGK